jgi:hypothetical protein
MRLRAHQASGIPRALCLEGGKFLAKLGRIAPREREGVFDVIASAAKQSIARGKEEWIASLRSQ